MLQRGCLTSVRQIHSIPERSEQASLLRLSLPRVDLRMERNIVQQALIKCPQSYCVFGRQGGAHGIGIYEGYAMLVAWRLVCPTVR